MTEHRSVKSAIKACVRRLIGDRRGNVLMICGFAILPMVFGTGMVIDYSRAAKMQTKLNAIADASALAAISTPMLERSIYTACDTARNTFVSQSAGLGGVEVDTATETGLQISITETYSDSPARTLACPNTTGTTGASMRPDSRTTTVRYAAQSVNIFGGVLGSNTTDIGSVATARSGLGVHYQVIFVADTSQSMAVGGTSTEVTKLENNKQIACAFACHDPNGTIKHRTSSYCVSNPKNINCETTGPEYCPNKTICTYSNTATYSDTRLIAKAKGYKLKIDYVNEAIADFTNELKPKMEKNPAFFSVGIDVIGSSFKQLQAPTSDPAAMLASAAKVDVEVAAGVAPYPGDPGWSRLEAGLDKSLAAIKNVGNGSSPTARKTYVVFLSDGVEDIPCTFTPGHNGTRCSFMNYVKACKKMKDAGITMFSVQAGYPAVRTSDKNYGAYVNLVVKLPGRQNPYKTLQDSMKECSSGDDKYWFATDGAAIKSAVSNIFSSIFLAPRLTK